MDPFQNMTNKTLPPLEALGPPFQLLLAVLYSVTAIFAFFLNLTAVIVLIVLKRSSADLRKYLLNLAFADILMAIFSIPFSYTDFMYGQWVFPTIMCPITNFITSCAVCVSVYTLIAIGIERYVMLSYLILKINFSLILVPIIL